MTQSDTFSVCRFPSGFRAVHLRRSSAVEYCGFAVRAGSRDELPGEEGLAHFVEHTIFKGTVNRSASRIINRMERVGGELNAYTTKEETYVYSIFPAGNFSRAAELIADLIHNSVFPDTELDREREVVAEEIDSYLDSPSESVYDDFDDLIFSGSSLGHNILGSRDTLNTFSSAKCRAFVSRNYTAHNSVFFYLGPLAPEKVFGQIERLFRSLPSVHVCHDYEPVAQVAPFCLTRGDGSNHQAHCVIGCRVPSLYSPQRYAVALLNNILGGPGMNSRLNIQLRERRGLVYSVESTQTLYSDTGLLTIYFGCNPEDTVRCCRLVRSQLSSIATKPLTAKAFEAARKQFIGQHIVASSPEQTILSAARSLLFRDEVITSADVIRLISDLTPSDLQQVVQYFDPSAYSTLILT